MSLRPKPAHAASLPPGPVMVSKSGLCPDTAPTSTFTQEELDASLARIVDLKIAQVQQQRYVENERLNITIGILKARFDKLESQVLALQKFTGYDAKQ
tara:strand:+ start:2799 stop:3092 length:294 start_codon:yes stop_codon:yes gene_type:complete